MSLSPSPQPSILDLDVLESDQSPTFVLKIGADAIEFDLLYCNEAFRKEGLREVVLAATRESVLFRSWTQAIGLFKKSFDFADRCWTAKVAGVNENLKVIRVQDVSSTELDVLQEDDGSATEGRKAKPLSPSSSSLEDDLLKSREPNSPGSLKDLPKTNINARWQSLQTMMEMSDVSVFEYEPSGKLIQANGT